MTTKIWMKFKVKMSSDLRDKQEREEMKKEREIIIQREECTNKPKTLLILIETSSSK